MTPLGLLLPHCPHQGHPVSTQRVVSLQAIHVATIARRPLRVCKDRFWGLERLKGRGAKSALHTFNLALSLEVGINLTAALKRNGTTTSAGSGKWNTLEIISMRIVLRRNPGMTQREYMMERSEE